MLMVIAVILLLVLIASIVDRMEAALEMDKQRIRHLARLLADLSMINLEREIKIEKLGRPKKNLKARASELRG